jgi:hypothetical protein
MINKLKSLAILSAVICMLFGVTSVKVSAFNLFNKNCNGSHAQGGNGSISPICENSKNAKNDSAGNNAVLRAIKSAANIIAFIGGVAAIIVIIISGLSLITSSGSSEQVANARRRIVYTAVGLAVIGLAWEITRFVTDKLL